MAKRLGSDSALSMALASNPDAPLVAGGAATFVVAAAAFAYFAWQAYKEKKHAERVDKIMALHQKYLSRITIEAYSETVSFPPIFQRENGNISSIEYSEAILLDMAESALKTSGSLRLADYRNHLYDSILLLISFHKEYNKDEDRVVQPVLEYLVHIISTKGLNFEGYDYDIAYMKALLGFINDFATTFGKKTLVGLNRVYSNLTSALQHLEHHKTARTQTELIEEAATACRVNGDRLLRHFVRFITPSNRWEPIRTLPLSLIELGQLSVARVNMFGCVDGPITMPLSPLSTLTARLIRYYLESIDSIDAAPIVPDLNFMCWGEVNSTLSKEETKLIYNTFKGADNFLTTKAPDAPPFHEFIPIEKKDLPERLKLHAHYGKLIHLVCSFQYLLTAMTKTVQYLGEEEASQPEKCQSLYHLHTELCEAISQEIRLLRQAFTALQKSNDNAMQVADKQQFFDSQLTLFSSIDATIKQHRALINERRAQLPLVQKRQNIQNENDELAGQLSQTYGFKAPPILPTLPSRTPSRQSTPRESITAPNTRYTPRMFDSRSSNASTIPSSPLYQNQ